MNENKKEETAYDRPATIGDMIRLEAIRFVLNAVKDTIKVDLDSSPIHNKALNDFPQSAMPWILHVELILREGYQI